MNPGAAGNRRAIFKEFGMEYLFENIYVDTEKLLRQTYKKILKKKVLIWTAVSVVMGLLFLFAGVVLDKPVYRWGSLIYVVLAVWYLLWPHRIARKAYKNMLKFYDGVIPETVVRLADAITLTQGETVTTIPYNKLKQVSILDDCLLLHNEIGGAYIVSNDGFTKGTKQEMLAFLKEKCPQLKLPDWQW